MIPIAAIYMVIMGVMMISVWTRDVLYHPEVDISKGIFKARDKSNGSIFWYHWLAEYSTAICLITGGVGLILSWDIGIQISFFGLGALFYTSLNSLGWAFADQSRYIYRVPMFTGLFGSIVCAGILIVKFV